MKPYARIPVVKVGGTRIPVYVNPKIGHNHGVYVTVPETRIEVHPKAHDTIHATLLHEALHAMDEMYSLQLGERRVRVLENVLLAFVQDNEELVHGLMLARRCRARR